MNTGILIGNIIGLTVFIVWLYSVYSWYRQGLKIPRYVHVIAIITSSISIGCLTGMYIGGIATIEIMCMLLFLPPIICYLGWVWMFGPDFQKKSFNNKL